MQVSIVYVTTWSTVDYTSVTSMHCRHVVTFLFHDCDKVRVQSVAAKRIGVGKMLYELQLLRVVHVGGDCCCSLYAY